MKLEVECYCCLESSLISELLIAGNDVACVTELAIFKKTLQEPEVLELQAGGISNVEMDGNGKITDKGLRYTAYSTFIPLCALRSCGKSRRFVVPACVVRRIRPQSQDRPYEW